MSEYSWAAIVCFLVADYLLFGWLFYSLASKDGGPPYMGWAGKSPLLAVLFGPLCLALLLQVGAILWLITGRDLGEDQDRR